MISNAIAQTLTPVTNGGGFEWWPIVVAAVVVLAIAGMIFWHKRNPTQQAEALATAQTELAEAARALRDAVHNLTAPTVTTFNVTPPPPPGPTPEQLAAIDAAQVALEAMKRSAGVQ